MKNKRLCIIGPSYPPVGGVSVYIMRLKKKLNQNGQSITHIFFNNISFHDKIKNVFYILFNYKVDEFIVNSGNIIIILLLTLRVNRSKIIYYDHNFRRLESWNTIQRKIFNIFLSKVDELWVVENNVLDYYKLNAQKTPRKTIVKNAYLEPIREDKLISLFFEDNKIITAFKKSHEPIVHANASSLLIYKDIDLYGIDLLVALIKDLRSLYPKIGLIVAIGSFENLTYLNSLKNEIEKSNLTHNILLTEVKGESWPIYTFADIFIRPTFSDGDSLSIREALDLNCTTLASDCVLRPKGCFTFRNRDSVDLLNATIKLLSKKFVVKNSLLSTKE